jgi:hypothetical protein
MDIIKNKITLLIAFIGLIGGSVWAYQTNFNIEPIILVFVSLAEILGYFLLPNSATSEPQIVKNKNEQNVNVSVNVGSTTTQNIGEVESKNKTNIDRNAIIESMQSRTIILFIDDDKNFNVVKILKDSNWKKVKTVVDIKSLDIPIVKESDIIFVDINGVGKLLNLEFEGLDLALMLKQRYPDKKVIIYSANRNNNSFHQAWDTCDFKLEKNALPYQFQNLVEEYSIEFYKRKQ